MKVCLDVDYRSDEAVVACVGFADWVDEGPCLERVLHSKTPPAAYEPGQFYVREMPYLLELLSTLEGVELIVIDGYVWLGEGRPGLGGRLYQQLEARVPVVGVAKAPFRGNTLALPVLRSGSRKPLFVTAAGTDARQAAEHVAGMSGEFRIPTLLKRVDALARGPPSPASGRGLG